MIVSGALFIRKYPFLSVIVLIIGIISLAYSLKMNFIMYTEKEEETKNDS
jgi:NADH:ubiquinone oxidoreductase subunit 2 (subunit N)